VKTGIIIAISVLGLALFAVPHAEGKDDPDLNRRLSGSTFVTTVDAKTGLG
jgi:hypothetical protein